MVIANGCPKSGTHALMELFQAMGLKRAPGIVRGSGDGGTLVVNETPADPETVDEEDVLEGRSGWFIHGHLPPVRDYGNAIPVTVIRDPRNVIVSYQKHAVLSGEDRPSLLDALTSFLGKPFFDVYPAFLDWQGSAPTVRYEDLPRVRWGSVYEGANQDRSTWTDRPSDWMRDWSALEKRQWRGAGGNQLVREAGYGR